MSNDKIIIRYSDYPDNRSGWVIKGLMKAKTKMDCSSQPLPNDDYKSKSWQIIVRCATKEERDEKVNSLLETGRYIDERELE